MPDMQGSVLEDSLDLHIVLPPRCSPLGGRSWSGDHVHAAFRTSLGALFQVPKSALLYYRADHALFSLLSLSANHFIYHVCYTLRSPGTTSVLV